MNRLIMGYVPMEEAGEPGGGAAAATPTPATGSEQTAEASTAAPAAGAAAQESTPATAGTTPEANAEKPAEGEPKPFLGEQQEKNGQAQNAEAKPATEEDYLKAVVKDEKILGTDKNMQLDQNLVKAMIPEAQKLGVSPEAMGVLANALAKAQIDAARDAQQRRVEYFNRMKEESIRKYGPNDFSQINAGIDHWFKPDGVMNRVIRSSELGADPEFLALMHYLGSKRVMDSLQGAEEGGGDSVGDPNGIGGISKLW